ncbi:MAG: hypothetical protein QME51_09815 [Planctomycetota bacterium]|nr:hypothetical protein [Planctomycetota bacterium]
MANFIWLNNYDKMKIKWSMLILRSRYGVPLLIAGLLGIILTGYDGLCKDDKDTSTGSWVCSTLDSAGGSGDTSIAIDSKNKVHISYYDATNKALKYATNK